ncbi:MAG: hypothetical protein ACHQ2Z_02005 [Elusimicrobiota bacterium]
MSAHLRAHALAAALFSLAPALLAAPTAVPPIDADIGSGQSFVPLAPAAAPSFISPIGLAAPALISAMPAAAAAPSRPSRTHPSSGSRCAPRPSSIWPPSARTSRWSRRRASPSGNPSLA